MKIFIIGATGVLGKRVVKLLVEQNHLVAGLARSDENISLLKSLHAEPRRGNLFDTNQMIALTKDCHAILHLATHIPKKAVLKKEDWKMNDRIRIGGTRNMVSAALVNNIKIFIQQSVTFIYGSRNDFEVDSKTSVSPTQISALQSVIEMEKIVREKLNPNFLVARFGSFYSSDSFQTQQLISNVRKRKMPLIGKGNYYWNLIHSDDAASAIAYSLNNFERLKGNAINFTDFSPIFFSDVIKTLAEKTKSKKPFSIPLIIARSILGRDVFDFLTMSHRILKNELIRDWQPRFKTFDEGITSVIDELHE